MEVKLRTPGEALWISVGKGFGFVAAFAAVWLLRIWVITILWLWYIVPAFQLPPLRMVYAFGLSIIVAHVMARRSQTNDKTWQQIAMESAARSLAALIMGWIGSFFL